LDCSNDVSLGSRTYEGERVACHQGENGLCGRLVETLIGRIDNLKLCNGVSEGLPAFLDSYFVAPLQMLQYPELRVAVRRDDEVARRSWNGGIRDAGRPA
jgi:hypothetical protein